MTLQIQAGSVLIADRPVLLGALHIESDPYGRNWTLVRGAFDLDRMIQRAGWNFFFMAGEITASFLGRFTPGKVRKALMGILGRVSPQRFNSLEITSIRAKRFLGLPYTTISAHWRHIQQNCRLDSQNTRSVAEKVAEWANGA